MSLYCIIKNFKLAYKELEKNSLIKTSDICDYRNGCNISLHSLLQYALIEGGKRCGFTSIPEFNISLNSRLTHLDKPIDKKKIGVKSKTGNQSTISADIAFIKPVSSDEMTIKGVGEICTLDEMSYCEHSDDVVTHYDKLLHLVEFSRPKIEFMIIIAVLPEKPTLITKGKNKGKPKLPWEQNNHTVAYYEEKWRVLTDILRQKGTDARLVSVREKRIDEYP